MNLSVLVAALKAAVLSALTSIGVSFASGFSVLAMGFTADERAIGAKVFAKFHDTYEAAKAASKSEIEAIEEAATAAYNEFCADEKAEFAKEAQAIVDLATSSFKSAAGLK